MVERNTTNRGLRHLPNPEEGIARHLIIDMKGLTMTAGEQSSYDALVTEYKTYSRAIGLVAEDLSALFASLGSVPVNIQKRLEVHSAALALRGGASVPIDNTPPSLSSVAFDGSATFSGNISEPGTVFILVDDAATRTPAEVIAGGGLYSTSFTVTAGANNQPLDFSSVAAGDHYLHVTAKDSAGNPANTVDTVLYTFPGAGAGAGIAEVGSVFIAMDQGTVGGPTATLNYTVQDTANILVARVTWISGTTGVESPSVFQFAGADMTQYGAAKRSRSASIIGVIKPSATGSQTLTFTVPNAFRSVAIQITEYSGVNTTAPVTASNAADDNSGIPGVGVTTTVDNSKVVGCTSVASDQGVDGLSVSNGTEDYEGSTGTNLFKDQVASGASKDITTSGSLEQLGWASTISTNWAASSVELNPA